MDPYDIDPVAAWYEWVEYARALEADTHRLAGLRFTPDELAGTIKLFLIIPDQKTDQHIPIETNHQRDRSSTGKAFRPFLCRRPATSIADLFFTRINTVPFGSGSEGQAVALFHMQAVSNFLWNRSLTLLVRVASVLMMHQAVILTLYIKVRNQHHCPDASLSRHIGRRRARS
jgi:hypothetical protein